MWKQQYFEMLNDPLRQKLSDYDADILIAIFSKLFPLQTLTDEQEARRVTQTFHFVVPCTQFNPNSVH